MSKTINTKITEYAYHPETDIKNNIISQTIEEISITLNNHAYFVYDETLRCLDIKKVSTIMMVTLLRTSFMARKFLMEWDSFLLRAKDEVTLRGKDPNTLFRGLN